MDSQEHDLMKRVTRRRLSVEDSIPDSSVRRRLYVRLLGECRELLREHKLTLPRPEKELLIAIRTGKYAQDQVFELGDDLTDECQQLLENSDLPDSVNVHILSRQIADAYQSHWRHMAELHG